MKSMNLLITATCGLLVIGCGSDDNYPDIKDPGGNAAPTASDASFTTQTDTELTGELMAMDDDGDDLTFALVDQATNGTVTVEDGGMFFYQPNATVTGSDSFTFEVSDGEATSSVAVVDITVEALEVSFSTYSRQAFEQQPTDEPLPVNGRAFEQDVTQPDAYDDLLMQ
ncbi:Ig-like domain-containing protein [Marinimicrobium agarilyticum]|uniref:Ig-like domain-containing protein n=1 Tax=Marinimicrobium agarilyticum TaxID=306546 RepID=UPI0003F61C54|nr:Ig-like domain-containing protein [Marinimicrobium agarilyticum]